MSSAVVVGGGIAGLSAASVLARHFDRVLLVDRDGLGVAHERRGVPQVDHLHVLMKRGWMALEELFPGMDADLARAGCPWINYGSEVYWVGRYGAFPRHASEVASRGCSRELLERTLRARVLEHPRIDVVERFTVDSWRLDKSGRRLAAVRATDGRELEARLFVDTSGRNSPFRRETLIEKVDAQASYASCLVRLPRARELPFRQVYVQLLPPHQLRGGGIVPIEDGLYAVVLIGAGGELPPGDREGLLDFARSLRDPSIAQVLMDAEFVGPIHCYRRIAGTRVIRVEHPLDNFVMMGDALCSFNPVYGQGMTVAALCALELARQMKEEGRPSQKGFESVILAPWVSACSEDLRVPGCGVENVSRAHRMMMSLSGNMADLVAQRATRDPQVHERMLRVMHMIDPPTSLLGAVLPRAA
ncbi:NAD(P)/FAD-dependent oxidoreductase [Myxococcaceae bacterium GXIMD 01537]